MARFPPGHCIPHFALEESYLREQRSRVAFYVMQKNLKLGIEPRPVGAPVEVPELEQTPNMYATKVKRAEQEKYKQIREEARASFAEDYMKPVDHELRMELYKGLSADDAGRWLYLKERKNIIPDQRYNFAAVTSWDYGWKTTDDLRLYNRPQEARATISAFWSRNGVPGFPLHCKPDILRIRGATE